MRGSIHRSTPRHMRTISVAVVAIVVVAVTSACPASTPQFKSITHASSARLLVASDARLAFVDGSDLRVIVPPAPGAPATPDATLVDELRTTTNGVISALAL